MIKTLLITTSLSLVSCRCQTLLTMFIRNHSSSPLSFCLLRCLNRRLKSFSIMSTPTKKSLSSKGSPLPDARNVSPEDELLFSKSIAEVSLLLNNQNLSPLTLTSLSLKRIQQTSALNCFITVTEKEAVKQAEASDQRHRQKQRLSPLDGIPVAFKDNFNVKGVLTTCASKMLSNFVSPYDATVVSKLIHDSGAVCLGKTNMDEYAIGSGCIDSFYGPCINPWKSGLSFRYEHQTAEESSCQAQVSKDFYVPGGSSGGSAVAVASGAVFAALGTDTGGSNRYPAALTGIVGFKPTYGLLSRHGLIPLSHTMDTVGIMTRSVQDASLVFDCIRGFDDKDSTSSRNQSLVGAFDDNIHLSGLRIGIPKEYLSFPEVSQEVLDLMSYITHLLEGLGAEVVSVSMPHTKYASSCYTVLNAAELASNFSCYDGIEYGLRVNNESSVKDDSQNDSSQEGTKDKTREDLYHENRSQGFGDAVKGRIQAGNFFLLKSNYDSYVKPAHQARRLVYQDFVDIFKKRNQTDCLSEVTDVDGNNLVDLLMTPMTRGPAKKYKDLAGKDSRELSCDEDVFAQPANLAGIPALTIPCIVSPSTGLPLAIQLISPAFSDNFLLSVAHRLEKEVKFPTLKFLSSPTLHKNKS